MSNNMLAYYDTQFDATGDDNYRKAAERMRRNLNLEPKVYPKTAQELRMEQFLKGTASSPNSTPISEHPLCTEIVSKLESREIVLS